MFIKSNIEKLLNTSNNCFIIFNNFTPSVGDDGGLGTWAKSACSLFILSCVFANFSALKVTDTFLVLLISLSLFFLLSLTLSDNFFICFIVLLYCSTLGTRVFFN